MQYQHQVPSLKFSPCISIPVIFNSKAITSCIRIPYESHNLKSQLHYSPKKSTQSSSNLWLSLPLYKQYEPFYHIFHGLRPIMTCLFNPTQYQDNLHGRHTKPYTVPYSRPGDNYNKPHQPLVSNLVITKIKEGHQLSICNRI